MSLTGSAAPRRSLSGVITSEGGLVEKPGLDLLVEMGWTRAHLIDEEPGPVNPTGRQSFRELVLPARLRAALRRINQSLSDEALQQAEIH
jgi:type I restriction enzyme R subunit